jgi:nucleotide-binding universal stress UspA family protein
MTTRNIQQPFRTVLVPTDLSEGSSAALDRGLALPLGARSRIDLVHVLSDVPAKARTKVEAAARQALEREVERARSLRPELEVTSRLLRGLTYVEIIRRARSLDAELVVIGRHGRWPVRDVFIGSTAARVVRTGETPVLVVRGAATVPYRRPLVATDLGDTLRQLAELALRIVGRSTTVNVVHAVHIPFEGFMAPTGAAREKLRRPAEEEARIKLARLLSAYRDHARWRPRVRTGDPRSILVGEAIRCRADVIVLGTHGRSGLSHALLGSVAEWTLANAPCDVLVARPVRFSFELP